RPYGFSDTNTANNTASDTATRRRQADLSIARTSGKSSAVLGTSDTYTITVTNNGPSTVSSINLSDTIPAGLLSASFGTASSGTRSEERRVGKECRSRGQRENNT